MIQRIQSLYMFAAVILLILLFFMPLAELAGEGGQYYSFRLGGLSSSTSAAGKPEPALPLVILNSAMLLLLLVSVFLFRKRVLQMRVLVYTLLLHIGMLIMLGYYLLMFTGRYGSGLALRLPVTFPLINIILIYLAYRGVRKDEALVRRSYDRLR